jgi:pimeloyl-ACP methyl ester carboxylesterase
VDLAVRGPGDHHKRTFTSDIDGSVQYYSVRPARPGAADRSRPGLVLSLHGASVEATGQAACYAAKAWAHVVAPTNRRPFGFDWEDWGRLDALEVLEEARAVLKTDPRGVWLTGHSMGGHGAWHLGATFPDRWAAIAPSAGWVSFSSYAGARAPENPTAVERLLGRCSSPSDTAALVRNLERVGVYVLHGDADDNVPVREARFMRKKLGEFHPDFVYHERPGAGHWWGNACVDWPPLFSFLEARRLPRREDVGGVDFVTASPGVSAWCHWAGVEAQLQVMAPSEVHLRRDRAERRFSGKTANVARLALDLAHLKEGPVEVELDGQKPGRARWPGKLARIWLEKKAGKWSFAGRPAAALKGPHRYGPFKEAFRNRMVFVYGTRGTARENAWSFARARFDAETFWYRGNGSVDVVSDRAFDAEAERDRNVIVYGHEQGNGAWKALLGKSPVRVRPGAVEVGGRKEKGDLACLFISPRPGSDRALVGVVAGSGPAGERLTELLPYFLSGVGYPDCVVLGPEVLWKGSSGVRLAGFFGADWGVESGEFQRGR